MAKSKSLTKTPEATAEEALKELHNEKVIDPEEVMSKTLALLEQYGLPVSEKLAITNPITGKKAIVTQRRDGYSEEGLAVALLDPKKTRDQKDFELSMYLWGRGSESSSMIVDLMRYKGEHTKETRVFKSQMRIDFETFVNMFVDHLEHQALTTASILDIDLKKEVIGYRAYLAMPNNKGEELTYHDYKGGGSKNRVEHALISQAIFQLDEAERLAQAIKNITIAREREKGKGIYVGPTGKAYTIDDPQFDDAVREDREATRAINAE
jgi:hypothetical protein